jgi:hypothetical protein
MLRTGCRAVGWVEGLDERGMEEMAIIYAGQFPDIELG